MQYNRMKARTKKAICVVGVLVIVVGMVNLLVYKYPSITFRLGDSSGRTQLHWAAWDGRTSSVKKLLAKGADVNARAKNGSTPLHDAALHGRTETVKILIANGADVNATDYDNKATPLHDAASAGHPETVKVLLAAGADAAARNRNGSTPLDWTEKLLERQSYVESLLYEKRTKACIQILREHSRGSSQSASSIGSTLATRRRYRDRVTTWVLLAGMVVSFVGYIWVDVIAFRKDVAWGIACLFAPINLIFVVENWHECRTAFLICIVGSSICIVTCVLGLALIIGG